VEGRCTALCSCRGRVGEICEVLGGCSRGAGHGGRHSGGRRRLRCARWASCQPGRRGWRRARGGTGCARWRPRGRGARRGCGPSALRGRGRTGTSGQRCVSIIINYHHLLGIAGDYHLGYLIWVLMGLLLPPITPPPSLGQWPACTGLPRVAVDAEAPLPSPLPHWMMDTPGTFPENPSLPRRCAARGCRLCGARQRTAEPGRQRWPST
jgi:hypothetical protein